MLLTRFADLVGSYQNALSIVQEAGVADLCYVRQDGWTRNDQPVYRVYMVSDAVYDRVTVIAPDTFPYQKGSTHAQAIPSGGRACSDHDGAESSDDTGRPSGIRGVDGERDVGRGAAAEVDVRGLLLPAVLSLLLLCFVAILILVN